MLKSAFISLLGAVICFGMSFAPASMSAGDPSTKVHYGTTPEGEPRLFTNLTLNVDGGNGEVYAIAKNTFTLFPSTVYVEVELYCSDTRTEDYTKMTLVASNQTADLNMGDTISATASTGGVAKYWLGRIYYKIDSGIYEQKCTRPFYLDANGGLIQ